VLYQQQVEPPLTHGLPPIDGRPSDIALLVDRLHKQARPHQVSNALVQPLKPAFQKVSPVGVVGHAARQTYWEDKCSINFGRRDAWVHVSAALKM